MSETPVKIPGQQDPDQKSVMILYGFFGASLILSLIPSVTVATFVIFLITGVLIAAYVMRGNAKPGSLKENHAIFVIRSIWIATLFGLVTTLIGTVYMMQNVDYSPIEACLTELLDSNPNLYMGEDAEAMTRLVMDLTEKIMSSCMDTFLAANMQTFLHTTIITAAPVLLYLIIR